MLNHGKIATIIITIITLSLEAFSHIAKPLLNAPLLSEEKIYSGFTADFEEEKSKSIIIFENERKNLPLKEVFEEIKDGDFTLKKKEVGNSSSMYLESHFGSLCDFQKGFTYRDLSYQPDEFIDM